MSAVSTDVISEQSGMVAMIERLALSPDVDVLKLEKLLDLQERILNRNAEAAFNQALTKAQSEMGRISADCNNPQTRSSYASYGKLDSVLRPIYTQHGFSLSFDEGDSPKEDHVRVLCHVAHIAGFSRIYHKDMPADGKGAKGGDVMTKTHASAAAQSYGMRYLLKGIFNVAIGEDDTDGNDAIEYITESQAADLQAKAEEVGADRVGFLKYLKVERLADLPLAKFQHALQVLEQKAKRTK